MWSLPVDERLRLQRVLGEVRLMQDRLRQLEEEVSCELAKAALSKMEGHVGHHIGDLVEALRELERGE
jgi:hypothetical protein